MKKVDFSQIEVEMIDGKMAKADLQHGENGLGNQIYMQARELKWKDLGRKIYYANGEVEINDDYCITIECETEEELQETFEKLQSEGYKCKISTL